jgi:hypothetical protein
LVKLRKMRKRMQHSKDRGDPSREELGICAYFQPFACPWVTLRSIGPADAAVHGLGMVALGHPAHHKQAVGDCNRGSSD